MRFLLDTHAVLWYFHEPERLSVVARKAIESSDGIRAISAVSFWEIAIKVSIGKLTIAEPLSVIQDDFIERGVLLLDIAVRTCISIQELPLHHQDPFDRLLAAQALGEGFSLISRDSVFDRYGVHRIW